MAAPARGLRFRRYGNRALAGHRAGHNFFDQLERAAVATKVFDNPQESRFELPLEGGAALAYYRLEGDTVVLTHTEVPEHLSGQGIGSRLAKDVFETVRTRGQKVVTECPFMASYGQRHPEYADLLASDPKARG
jgi:predicted GNAT family acetyltransferase